MHLVRASVLLPYLQTYRCVPAHICVTLNMPEAVIITYIQHAFAVAHRIRYDTHVHLSSDHCGISVISLSVPACRPLANSHLSCMCHIVLHLVNFV